MSFEVQRQNLKWVYNASIQFQQEMERLNTIEDMHAHSHLKGALFRRKTMDADRLTGLGCFGAAGLTYAFFPYVAQWIGTSATLLGISGTSLLGMFYSSEKDMINSIEWTDDGKLKFSVSQSLFKSNTIVVDQGQASATYSLQRDRQEGEIENNVVVITNFACPNTGEMVEAKGFTLPADAWKDYNTLDWVLAYQQPELTDTTESAFNDFMKN